MAVWRVVQGDGKKIDNLRYALESTPNKTVATSFLSIASNGERVCSKLKSAGINASDVQWDGTSSQSDTVSKMLPALDTLIQKANTAESSSFVCYEKTANEIKCNKNTICDSVAVIRGRAEEFPTPFAMKALIIHDPS